MKALSLILLLATQSPEPAATKDAPAKDVTLERQKILTRVVSGMVMAAGGALVVAGLGGVTALVVFETSDAEQVFSPDIQRRAAPGAVATAVAAVGLILGAFLGISGLLGVVLG